MNLKSLFPHASQAFISINPGLQNPIAQCPLLNEPLAKKQRKAKSPERIILCYTSYRQRLLDIDNLVGGTKLLTDALRYCGAIPGDTQDQISLQIAQKKVATKKEEKTLIEVIYPCTSSASQKGSPKRSQ